MNLSDFQSYLKAFNARDYDKLADYWADSFSVQFEGTELFNCRETVKSFYGFLHSYINETIIPDRILIDERSLFMEARVRIEAKRDLTPETIAASDFPSLKPIKQGMTIDLPQFIHYHLEDGKFVLANCIMSGEPKLLA
ncbi:hypothetical protein CWO89_17275 [Bradyrhizobium sp. Leo170]|nr:hypothetical protein CWO89_17275 [Bradyrhizobium sp. Leo170]